MRHPQIWVIVFRLLFFGYQLYPVKHHVCQQVLNGNCLFDAGDSNPHMFFGSVYVSPPFGDAFFMGGHWFTINHHQPSSTIMNHHQPSSTINEAGWSTNQGSITFSTVASSNMLERCRSRCWAPKFLGREVQWSLANWAYKKIGGSSPMKWSILGAKPL